MTKGKGDYTKPRDTRVWWRDNKLTLKGNGEEMRRSNEQPAKHNNVLLRNKNTNRAHTTQHTTQINTNIQGDTARLVRT